MKRKVCDFNLLVPTLAIVLAALAIPSQLPAQDPRPGPVSGGVGSGGNPPPQNGAGAGTTPDSDQLFFDDPDIQTVASPEAGLLASDDKTKLETLGEVCGLGDKSDSTLAQFLLGRVQDRFKSSAEYSKPDFVTLVHVAAYKNQTAPSGDCWYAVGREKILPPGGKQVPGASGSERWSVQVGTTPRLYGSKTIGVLFFHLDDKSASDIGSISGKVAYKGVVKKKLPSNLQNLLSIIRLPTRMAAASGFSYWGHGLVSSVSVPSDVTIMAVGAQQGSAKRIGSKVTADNEGKHFWDASVLVPVTKLSGLSYSGTPAQFSPKQVNLQTVYGAMDVYISTIWGHPIDLKSGNERLWMPRVVAGTGITGHPGDRFLFGGSLGTPQLQGFVGIAYGRVDRLNPSSAPGGSAAVVQQFYHSNLAFGVNIPVAQALKSLSSKK